MKGVIVRAVSLRLCTGCGAATEPTIADAAGLDASTAGDGDHGESQVEGTVGGQVFSSEGALAIVEAPPARIRF